MIKNQGISLYYNEEEENVTIVIGNVKRGDAVLRGIQSLISGITACSDNAENTCCTEIKTVKGLKPIEAVHMANPVSKTATEITPVFPQSKNMGNSEESRKDVVEDNGNTDTCVDTLKKGNDIKAGKEKKIGQEAVNINQTEHVQCPGVDNRAPDFKCVFTCIPVNNVEKKLTVAEMEKFKKELLNYCKENNIDYKSEGFKIRVSSYDKDKLIDKYVMK